MYVINLWGAPSSGKSTVAAGLFFLMKINKMKVELVNEFAKELVFDGRTGIFGDQNFIFAEQERRIKRLYGQDYDFVITDSPSLLPLFYDRYNEDRNAYFPNFVLEEYHRKDNLNYMLKREHPFEKRGRRHTEKESIIIDEELRVFLNKNNIPYKTFIAGPKTPESILADIQKTLALSTTELPFDDLDNEKVK